MYFTVGVGCTIIQTTEFDTKTHKFGGANFGQGTTKLCLSTESSLPQQHENGVQLTPDPKQKGFTSTHT